MLNTYAERIHLEIEADCFYHAVRRARTILDFVSAEWFNNAEVTMFMRDDIDVVADIIDAVSLMLFEAMREFKLETSPDDDAPEIEAFFEHAEQYKLNREVNALHHQIIDTTRRIHTDASAALDKRRGAAAKLPDAEALPILRKILTEARGM